MGEFDYLFNSDEDSPKSDLEMENMIKRLEIEMTGGKLVDFKSDELNIPPEVESEFLNAILTFERFKKNAKFLKVKDLCNIEDLKHEEEISSEEMILELDRVQTILKENGIIVSSIKDVEDIDMYKLIREHILDLKVPDMKIKGLMNNFLYEDFYRDEEVEVIRILEAFQVLFSFQNSHLQIFTKNAKSQIDELKKFYKEIRISEFEINQLELFKTVSNVVLDAEVELEAEDGSIDLLKGQMMLKLKKSSKNWKIDNLILP